MDLTGGFLFAGIGGFELASQWAGIRPVWSNEIDQGACNILRKDFQHDIIQKDVRDIGGHNLRPVFTLSAGFPCQPFSLSGNRNGTEDHRYLWPETHRVIDEIRPPWFIGENVAGLLSMAQPIWESYVESKTHISDEEYEVVIQRAEWYVLNRIIEDLEEIGYQVQTFSIPAAAVGAWHRRERVWIIAHTDNSRTRTSQCRTDRYRKAKDNGREVEPQPKSCGYSKDVSNANGDGNAAELVREADKGEAAGIQTENELKRETPHRQRVWPEFEPSGSHISDSKGERFQGERYSGRGGSGLAYGNPRHGAEYWSAEPGVGRMANGIPNRVDRLKGLGNAIVPQVYYEIAKGIKDIYLAEQMTK